MSILGHSPDNAVHRCAVPGQTTTLTTACTLAWQCWHVCIVCKRSNKACKVSTHCTGIKLEGSLPSRGVLRLFNHILAKLEAPQQGVHCIRTNCSMVAFTQVTPGILQAGGHLHGTK